LLLEDPHVSLFGGGHKSAAQTPTRAMGIDLQGAQYGAPMPVVFGRNKLAGNVIWYDEFKAIAHTQKQQGGKGGGGGGQTSTSYTYSVSYMLGLHEGVGNVVNVYDGSSVRSLSSVGGLAFTGAQGQAPWSHLSGDAALGYSGTVLVAFQNKDLGSSASLPNYNFEVDGRNQFSASIKDANPADIVTAVCTDSQIGINFAALGDLTNFKNYCTAAGIFFSPVYDTQNPAQSTLEDLFKYANSAPFFSEGKLKVVPYGDETITGNGVTYAPSLTAVVDLGRDDFITNGTDDPVTVRRVAPADAMNIVRLEYKDRANTYHTMPAVASFDQDVVGTGSRADQSESVDMITDGAVARLVVQNLLQRTYYIRNTYEFQLSWRFCDLEPMDIVTLTDGNTGLYLTPVRITEITEDEHGLLQVTAEEFPEGVSHASIYATQPNAGTGVDPNADPGPITSPYLFRGPGFLVPSSQPEIWVAVSGVDPMWAGCDVYLSQDGTSYTYLTTHSRRAAYGETTNSLAAGSDPDTTGAPNVVLNGPVELLGGTQADADQFITLAMIDNEIVAYQTATLASGPSYTLGYLRRGGYGTAQAAHAAGAPFVRLDENILRIPVDPSQIGQTVYLKFVSFNVFGKGGRTLADETAYTYIVGTNIELPDVPVTPDSPTVTAVADGVSITWFNPNPAAVGCTSIEYATASGGPWTVLAQVGPTSTSYVHHFITGATYYYRLRSRGAVISAGWSAYTAVLSNKGKTVADGADVTGAVTGTPVFNPNFLKDLSGWSFDTAGSGEWYWEAGAFSPLSGVGSYLVHKGVAGQTTTTAHNIGGGISVKPGQGVTATVALRALTGANQPNAGSRAYVRIGWYNSAGGYITNSTQGVTICTPDAGSNYFVQGVSRVYGNAPANAVRAIVEVEFDNHTAGFFTATAAAIALQPGNIGEVPDGGGRYAVNQVDSNGLAIIDLSQAGHVNKTQDYIGDGVTYGRPLKARLNAGKPWIDFSETIHTNKKLDYIADTGSYAKQPVMGGSAIVIPNANFAAPVDANGAIPGWVPANGGVLSYFTTNVTPFTNTQCLHITASGSTPSGFGTQSPNFKASPGDTFYIKGWAYSETGGAATIILYYFSSSGGYLGEKDIPGTAYNVWQQLSGSDVAPANTAYVFIRLMNTGTGGGSSYFYDIHLTRSTNLAAEVAGTLSTQRNLPMVTWGNYGSMWSGLTLTYSSTTTSCTFSASAASLIGGGDSIAYNSSTVTVTGSAGTTVTYWLYYDDPTGTGGSKSLQATTTQLNSLNSNGRVRVGQVTVTYPTSGTGGGTAPGGCPQVDEPVIRRGPCGAHATIRAGDVRDGDYLLLSSGQWGRVTYSETKLQPGVRVVGTDGSSITCSATAPLETAEGPCVLAPYTRGLVLRHRLVGGMRVADVFDAGDIWVQHITCENDCFWVGDYSHHNLKPGN
jgi:hypothetical protein